MADIGITSANVVADAAAVIARGIAGAAVNAGKPVYADAADSNKLKHAAHTSVATAAVVGIALNDAANNQPLAYAVSGNVTYGANLTAATVFVLGSAAGTISPSADLDSSSGTRYGTVLGIGISTTVLKVGIIPSGVLNP